MTHLPIIIIIIIITYPSSGRTFGLSGAIGVRSSGARWFESDFTENS
jgi:hypothetical protein